MPLPWFRMYTKFANDADIQMMPEHMQRRLLMIFCLRGEETLGTSQEREIAFRLRVTESELFETKALFVRLGFIDEAWNIVNWNRLQFPSDSSTDRTRRYRERQRTSQERPVTEDVTVEKRREEIRRDKKTPPPKAVAFVVPEWVSQEPWAGFVEMRKKIGAPLTDRAAKGILRELESLRLKGHDPGAVLDQSTERCWRGIFEIRKNGANGNGHYETRNERITREALEKLGREEAQHAGQPEGGPGS